ncbi:MAG: trypsin-like peptidase domain-containing protein [Myxococcales bacterium]|nr:trypsin-like peptidase domain-containing protein [Myxococcales bacterium]
MNFEDPNPRMVETPRAWIESLERVARAVVSVRIDATRPFDTGWNDTAQATAFVVDAEQGLLLTNRHVVRPGPVVAEAVFLNHEEATLRAVYRDPVHDFGFFRYDPAALRYMEPVALALRPDRARVGTEIRVVGNDAGEKLSILAGTLARLDRPAPSYGNRKYNDFNTFYVQAASSTSGGSSGSPVVDVHGDVVGLNAGSKTQAASSFFLPLDRIVPALARIRRGEPVPRGTLLTTFAHTPFDELRRLGLPDELEARARARDPDGNGLLIVEKILPGGPTDGQLELGDILIAVDDVEIATFVALEDHLDARVGQQITLTIARGGQLRAPSVEVVDLHAVSPSRYLEVGGAILHDLSYQRARSHDVPLSGVYVASPGYLLTRSELDRDCVIVGIGGQPTPTLAQLEARLAAIPHDAPVQARFYALDAPSRERTSVFFMDRRWFPMTRTARDDAACAWVSEPFGPPPPPAAARPTTITFPDDPDPRAHALVRSLVRVDTTLPFKIDGIHGSRFSGAGVLVDRARGLVLTDRNTVPITLGDVRLTVAGAVEVPGEIVFVHPLHNLAVVRFDPALLGDTDLREVTLASAPARPGDALLRVALRRNHQIFVQGVEVTTIEPLELPLPHPPRFLETNLERISVDSPIKTTGGLLANEAGEFVALWAVFSFQRGKENLTGEHGIPCDVLGDFLPALRRGEEPTLWDPAAEFRRVSLATARLQGLSDEAAARLEAHDRSSRHALQVSRALGGGGHPWQVGDIVLAVDGEPITRFRELERALTGAPVRVDLLREGVEEQVALEPVARDGRGTRRVIHWAGALLQELPRAVTLQRGLAPAGVYISLYWYGSPASRSKLRAARAIVAVDERPTPNLDAFLEVVRGRPDRSSLRIKSIDLEGKARLQTVRLDLEYYPTYELCWDGDGWRRVEHEA